ncbi:MAG TPA: response regulator [Nitrospira sp.]|nr:response regulator [Nitrospira sp.]
MDGNGKRVLVVDDDHHARFRMGAILARHGYNVVPACNGITALDELRKRHFDVVITDDRMPQLSGVDFLKQIQARHPKLPVILASTDIQEYEFRRDSRPFACIRKPYQTARLLRAVRLAAQTTGQSDRSLVTSH